MKKVRTIALLLTGLLLAGCTTGSAKPPMTSAATTTSPPQTTLATTTEDKADVTTTVPTTTTVPMSGTTAPITTDAPTTTVVPETTPLVPETSESDVPTTTDTPVTTPALVVTTTDAPTSTTTDEMPVTIPSVTTTEETPMVVPTVPTTTTSAPITIPTVTDTTTKAPTTTSAPVTTTTAPVTTAPHSHSYGAWATTKDATCMVDGTQKRTCECGKSETKAISATGHDFGAWKVTKAATEQAEGEEARTCEVCGKKETRKIAKVAHTHTYGEWQLCDDYVNESRTCESCGEVETQIHYATEADERLIADRVIYYINQYRAEEGTPTATKLDRLTLVAEMRSEQLVTNFAHDTDALRECATYYQYGEHKVYEETRLDMETFEVIYTGNILDYYSPPVGEAIGYDGANAFNTIDGKAEAIALGYKNSPGHWRYVGGSSPYMAVGITYADWRWYSVVFTCSTAEYE